jgi:hypothetical protein
LSTAIWDRDTGRLMFWKYGSPSVFVRGDPMSIGITECDFELQHSVASSGR